MANDIPAVRSSVPPALVIRVVNPLMRRLLRSPVSRRMPPSIAVLSFTGRRSGRHLEIPVGVHDVDGTLCVFTDRPWRRNFTDGHPVTLIRQGQQSAGQGELIEDQQQVAPALATAVRKAGSPRRLGLSVARGHEPTTAELAAIGRSMIRLQLPPPNPSQRS